jgi:photosystem II stability/assembly factor-like uncharacterized protein
VSARPRTNLTFSILLRLITSFLILFVAGVGDRRSDARTAAAEPQPWICGTPRFEKQTLELAALQPQPLTADRLRALGRIDEAGSRLSDTIGQTQKFWAFDAAAAGWTASAFGTNTLNAVRFADASVGWAVGGSGTVLKTISGGATWAIIISNSTADLLAVDFIDFNVGWTVGTNGAVLKTTDRGGTWVRLQGDKDYTLNDVDFVDANTGWAVGTGGKILKTTNGGASFPIEPASGTNNTLSGVAFVDALTGWAVGASGTILKSVDGGITWTAQTSGTTEHLEDVVFVNSTTGWATGAKGTILQTTNGGSTWSAQTSGSVNTLFAIDAVDASTAWAVGAGGTILKTTDGGTVWRTQTTGTVTLRDVDFVDHDNGWAVGGGGFVTKTTTGGVSGVYSVTATLRAMGTKGYVYVDNNITLATSVAEAIAREFDSIHSNTTSAFGSEWTPGIDGDPRITILVLDIQGSGIAGYFYGVDEFPDGTYPDARSNEREMLYMDPFVFNPAADSRSFYRVLAHELQHLIHWNQDRDEETWVNEGLSELAGFVAGYGHSPNIPFFLQTPDKSLATWENGVADYGATYMFMLYLWEKFGGNTITHTLTAQVANGIAGIEAALLGVGSGDGFRQVFQRWSVANYLDDVTIAPAPYAYDYQNLSLVESAADNVNTFLRPSLTADHVFFPVGTTNSVDSAGTVRTWAADYLRLTGGDGSALALTFDGFDLTTFGLSVVRSTTPNFSAGTNTVELLPLSVCWEGSTQIEGFGGSIQGILLVPRVEASGAGAPSYHYTASIPPSTSMIQLAPLANKVYIPLGQKSWTEPCS